MESSGERNRWKRGKKVEGLSKEVIMTRTVAIKLRKEKLTCMGAIGDLKDLSKL